jgi:phosphate starvation-inducible PhoH-like protein
VAKTSFEINGVALLDLLGEQDKNLKRLEAELPGLVIQNRGNVFNLTGDQAQLELAIEVLDQLAEMIRQGLSPDPRGVTETIRIIQGNEEQPAAKILAASTISTPAKTVRAKTAGQKEYLDAIDENTITFGIGPAGTGKTYLAVAKAVEALYRKEVSRIILTRPAVEAGERLGFLPGTHS